MSSLPKPETLGKRNFYQITTFLKSLTNKELTSLGLMLGLSYPNLRRMRSDAVLDGLVHAWLRREDDVMEFGGDPTWENLSTTLQHLGHNDIASEIEEGKGAHYLIGERSKLSNMEIC